MGEHILAAVSERIGLIESRSRVGRYRDRIGNDQARRAVNRANADVLVGEYVDSSLPRPSKRAVNDLLAPRVLLFDSTFQHFTVIVDSISGVGRIAYHGLIAYRGDSTLCVTPMSQDMLVIDPDGRIVRTMAIPDRCALLADVFGS